MKKFNDCKKKKFSKTEAEIALVEIKSSPDYQSKAKKESRIYQCYKCGCWHLTSMSQSTRSKLEKDAKKSQERRIYQEADYWNRKLGIR